MLPIYRPVGYLTFNLLLATPKTEAKKTAAKEAKKETAKPPTEVWETLNVRKLLKSRFILLSYVCFWF